MTNTPANGAERMTNQDLPESSPDNAPVRLRLAGSRGTQGTLLVGMIVFAATMLVGSLTLWGNSNWAHLVCIWCGIASALTVAILLAGDLFRPQLLTRRRVKILVHLLWAFVAVALACGVIGLVL